MKFASGLCLGLLLAGLAAAPGSAQGIPHGSYLDSCNGAKVEGASLLAQCQRRDGSEQHSALLNFDRCLGDIANENGVLNCNFNTAAGAPLPVPAPPTVITQAADRCGDLHRQARDLHDRLDRTIDPIEHARLEGRLHEVRDREGRCP